MGDIFYSPYLFFCNLEDLDNDTKRIDFAYITRAKVITDQAFSVELSFTAEYKGMPQERTAFVSFTESPGVKHVRKYVVKITEIRRSIPQIVEIGSNQPVYMPALQTVVADAFMAQAELTEEEKFLCNVKGIKFVESNRND